MPSTSNGRESVEVGLVEKESGGSCGTKAKKGMKRFSLINGASMATAGAERAGLLELNNGSRSVATVVFCLLFQSNLGSVLEPREDGRRPCFSGVPGADYSDLQ